jgi:hypothetical protein
VDRICGIINAAIAPCATRAAINTSLLQARPQSKEAAVKPPTPSRNPPPRAGKVA